MTLEEITYGVKRIIEYSQGFTVNDDFDLVDKWFENKKWFIEQMNGEFIISTNKVITYTLSEEEKEKIYQDFVYKLSDDWIDAADFIKDNGYMAYFSNTVKTECEYNGITIPAGMKMSKALKFFIDDEYSLRKWQDRMSEVIQKNKITGKLCLSVHPYDFLSSSENCENWRSCHALNGDYRSGNLSYMLDSCTIMAYLCGEENKQLPRFPKDVPWNSKKWRCLLFVSDDRQMVFAGRQYPFESQEILNATLDLLCSLKTYHPWFNTSFRNLKDSNGYSIWLGRRYFPIEDELRSIKSFIFDNSNLHYNDLLYSTFYTELKYTYGVSWYTLNSPNLATSIEKTLFHLGSKVKCLCCNEELIQDSEIMLCPDCAADLDSDYIREDED